MSLQYDIEKLNALLLDFYNITGININLRKDEFVTKEELLQEEDKTARKPQKNTVFINKERNMSPRYCKIINGNPEGKWACDYSDACLLEKCRNSKQMEVHICHAGLVDVAIPILYDTKILGYIILGQMREKIDFSSIKKNIAHLGFDMAEMKKHYEAIPIYDYEKIQSVANLASVIAKYILLENMIKPAFNRNIEKAIDFINDNLDKSLTIEYITKNINVSKSVLYKNFREFFNCTVNEYINNRRIDKSVELLLNTDLSIEEVSSSVGFSSAAYYTANFKKLKGITPLKFKRQQGV